MPSKMWVRLMLMVAMGIALEGNELPGVVVRITQKGLDYVSKKVSYLLQNEMMKIPLPKHLQIENYEFISMMISKVLWEKFLLSPFQGKLKYSITQGLILINGKWSDHKPVKNHIPFDLRLDNISITTTFNIGKNNKHQITVSVSTCLVHIRNIHIFTAVNQSMLTNIYKEKFQKVLQSNVNNEICGMIKNSTTSTLQPYLQTMPGMQKCHNDTPRVNEHDVKVNVDKITGINYSLMKPPKIMAHDVELSLKGQFFSLTHHHPRPSHPTVMHFHEDLPKMIYFGFSREFFESARQVYKAAGIKSFTMSNSMVPKDCKYQLMTNFYGTLIPELSQKFPDMTMKIVINLPSVPTVIANARKKIAFMSSISTNVYAMFSNSSVTPLFTLNLNTSVTIHIAMKNGFILGYLVFDR
ncbi:bactericidal permeability-increasing protein-like [Macrotis lagotis]|uniref:bactericidal permeability-increasing protein-like n=1 Tax=Macrotis lagotis TaxID=92651 RepID=UPI003D685EB4